MAPGVLVVGNDFQAVGILRGLAAESIPSFLLASERGIACYSNLAKRQRKHYGLIDSEQATQHLLKLADEEGLRGWVIACVNDETVELLAKNHDSLSQVYRLPVPPWEASEKFYDKEQAYLLAESLGIPIPRRYAASSLEQLLKARPDYPLVLKPTFKKNYYSQTNNKAIRVNNQTELERCYSDMNRLIPASQIVVQELIPGGVKNLYSYAALFDGREIVSGVAAARLRQHPMDFGHATTYAESRDKVELKELAEKFLRGLGYRGVAEVEFMWDDRTSQYKFIEMNGRFWGWHALTQIVGLNFPADFYRMMLGEPVKWRQPSRTGSWVRTITDIPTILQGTLNGSISLQSDLLPTLRKKKGYAVWSWKDPIPSMVEVLMAPYLWFKKGF